MEALETMRVVVLTGARQTGKTTLALALGREDGRSFVTLDRPETLETAEHDPEALWAGRDRVTIDEVQRSPRILQHIKIEVDRRPAPGRFLLTGSANLLLMAAVTDSLAGRAVYVTLPPLTLAERFGRPSGGVLAALLGASDATEAEVRAGGAIGGGAWRPPVSLERAVYEGGYPEAVALRDDVARDVWRGGYVSTCLERDLRNLAQIADLVDFARLLRLAVLRSGRLLNIDGLARDAGVAATTARRYLNLAETAFQVVRLSACTASRSQRLIKSPKLYATDSGLGCHLAGIREASAAAASPSFGALAETYVLQHLSAQAGVLRQRPNVLYWRTARGHEVDFVVETAERMLPIEVKTARTVGRSDLRGLGVFLDEYADRAPLGVLLYGGDEPRRLSSRILALPWWWLAGG
jgi:hypothetical protein